MGEINDNNPNAGKPLHETVKREQAKAEGKEVETPEGDETSPSGDVSGSGESSTESGSGEEVSGEEELDGNAE